ncbi:MAG: hypothetical protein PHD39_08850 [Methylobacter tundripaludum]|uniref:Uncharacterized protein n=2 Tax=Methylobacter tundripaludum TaxID=173365 RepID=A0A2S6HAB5_9GAMM|nr:hypothetical protein [Methylobacter tundripaludum]PPK74370.1 hypothetical protein B0F87_10912 [Methylobacter tundripaludum]
MIKWFFLSFIALIFLSANAAAFDSQLSLDSKIFAVVAVNLFTLSLALIWLGSYYQKYRGAGYGVFGHSTVYLSGGIGLIGLGFHSILMGNCNFLIGHERVPGILSKLATEKSACSWLSLFLILLGLFLSWPSLKLIYGITWRSTGARL